MIINRHNYNIRQYNRTRLVRTFSQTDIPFCTNCIDKIMNFCEKNKLIQYGNIWLLLSEKYLLFTILVCSKRDLLLRVYLYHRKHINLYTYTNNTVT